MVRRLTRMMSLGPGHFVMWMKDWFLPTEHPPSTLYQLVCSYILTFELNKYILTRSQAIVIAISRLGRWGLPRELWVWVLDILWLNMILATEHLCQLWPTGMFLYNILFWLLFYLSFIIRIWSVLRKRKISDSKWYASQSCQLVRIFRNLYGNQTQLRKYGKPSKNYGFPFPWLTHALYVWYCVCGMCV